MKRFGSRLASAMCILLTSFMVLGAADPSDILKRAEKNVSGNRCEMPSRPQGGRAPASFAPEDVLSPSDEFWSEVKLKLDCPMRACQNDRRAELMKLFKEKVSKKSIWLYDFEDKRLKGKVTIRKRTDKGETSLTVKLKDVPRDQLAAITEKYLKADTGVKGNKCEQDWNEQDGDMSPYSCSLTVVLPADKVALDEPNAQTLLTPEQRELIKEYKGIDLSSVTEPFAVPATFDSEEQKLLADSEVSVETWYKAGSDAAGRECYAFEISTKVPAAEAASTSARLNGIVRSFLEPAGDCALVKPKNQNQTKSM